jgi:hypothetical protein
VTSITLEKTISPRRSPNGTNELTRNVLGAFFPPPLPSTRTLSSVIPFYESDSKKEAEGIGMRGRLPAVQSKHSALTPVSLYSSRIAATKRTAFT